MAIRRKYGFGSLLLVVVTGVALLFASFAAFFYRLGHGIAAPVLFLAALGTVRVGTLMRERRRCETCGDRVEQVASGCPGCGEA